MDDQSQYPSDPSATQIPRKRKMARSSQAGRSASARRETSLASPSQPLSAGNGGISQSQPRPTRQLPTPQPILFSEIDIEILEEGEQAPLLRRLRLRRTRRWLRSRSGRITVPLIALLVGLAVGLASILWYGLSGEGPVVLSSNSAQGNLIVEANQDFVTQLVRDNLANAGLPGQVKNVSVTLARGDALTIQGDDVYSVLGLNLSRHFVINAQPYVQSCILQIHVTHANLGGIPVTGFVQSFEGNVNKQLARKPANLPSDFTYCTLGVRTEPGGMFITYKAISLGK